MNNVNRIPAAFIFQGRWENDDTWKGKLEPIKATLFYIGEKGSPYIEGKPVVVRVDRQSPLFQTVITTRVVSPCLATSMSYHQTVSNA